MTVEKFLGEVIYDPTGQMIFAKNDKDGLQLIGNVADLQEIISVRGWGSIQNLFKTEKEAVEFQDKLGQFMADAFNEKLIAHDWEAYSKKLQAQLDALKKVNQDLTQDCNMYSDKITKLEDRLRLREI